jgi:hypothetical protein
MKSRKVEEKGVGLSIDNDAVDKILLQIIQASSGTLLPFRFLEQHAKCSRAAGFIFI